MRLFHPEMQPEIPLHVACRNGVRSAVVVLLHYPVRAATQARNASQSIAGSDEPGSSPFGGRRRNLAKKGGEKLSLPTSWIARRSQRFWNTVATPNDKGKLAIDLVKVPSILSEIELVQAEALERAVLEENLMAIVERHRKRMHAKKATEALVPEETFIASPIVPHIADDDGEPMTAAEVLDSEALRGQLASASRRWRRKR